MSGSVPNEIGNVTPDPDRYFRMTSPGSQEWWYFDALSEDGRDGLAIVWYAGLPFDPAYGVAALRHLRHPERCPAPDLLDHCAISVGVYRDGKLAAYALNAHRAGSFAHQADPFEVRVATSVLARDKSGYHLRVDTPEVDGRSRIEVDLHFKSAPGTQPFELDLGSPGSNHFWIAAAPDCTVSGRVARSGRHGFEIEYRGRGYHDHNAGSQEISRAIRRWTWGRVHDGETTAIYYIAEPMRGAKKSLGLVWREGRVVVRADDLAFEEAESRRTIFGLRYPGEMRWKVGDHAFRMRPRHLVDSGPFYLRWIADFEAEQGGRTVLTQGFAELLDPRHLNRPYINWMIPYRLKRPSE